jgi:Ca2+-transporting ATPase
MSIRRLCTSAATFTVDESSADLPEEMHSLVEFGVLACPRDPFDPMEKAFLEIGRRTLTGTEHLHPKWTPVREYPLTPALLAVTHVWRSPERESLVVATKGAPEAVFDLCHLGPAESEQWRERATRMAKDGLRVLGVARSRGVVSASPEQAHDIEFDMVGLVGLEDPLRPDIADAVSLCKRAHIRVVMITGDHPDTARAIASAAGIDAGGVVLGVDVDRMDDGELAAALTRASVIARAVPAHKLRIVRSLRAQGLVIGMTGDGVNDAPALKAADVGIAMGARGTEVAREAASLVLVNDDFGSIVDAVRSGRRIYDNLRKAFGYIVAVHIPIAGLSVVPALLGWASVVLPVHVVFLELIIDPACSIVFEMEPEESNLMDNPPRSHGGHLLAARQTLWNALLGTASLCGTLWSLAVLRDAGHAVAVQRALAFVSLVAGNLSILVATRSFTQPSWASVRKWNPALPVLFLGAIGVLIVVVGVAPVRNFFGFELGTWRDLVRAVLAAAAPVFAVDSLKPLARVAR